MSRTINPWQFIDPYISYTPILAAEMNGKLTGISTTLFAISTEINRYAVRLPDAFSGNPIVADGPYHNTLLGIDENGDVALFDKTALLLASGKDLTVVKTAEAAFTVNGDSHANLYFCQNADTDPEGVTAVTVGEATATVNGEPVVAAGSSILFTQATDTPLVFIEAPDVTIIPPKGGLLKAYGAGCIVGLLAIDQYTWQLFGDVYLGEEPAP